MAMIKVVPWAEHVRRWRNSSLTRAAYCAEQGVNSATLSYWAWRLNEAQRTAPAPMTPTFVPVQMAPAATVPMMVEVSSAGGLRLGLPAGIDVVWATALVKAMAC